MPKEITPKALCCGPFNCPALYEVTPAEMRCHIAECPAIYEITTTEAKCEIAASCPALFEQEDGVLVIGKIAPVPDELKAKIGPDETLVWVPKGLLKDIEWA